jgi:hypothetical protein
MERAGEPERCEGSQPEAARRASKARQTTEPERRHDGARENSERLALAASSGVVLRGVLNLLLPGRAGRGTIDNAAGWDWPTIELSLAL